MEKRQWTKWVFNLSWSCHSHILIESYWKTGRCSDVYISSTDCHKTVMHWLWAMLWSGTLQFCLTKVLWFITLLAQLILNTESRNGVRSRNPGDNKAVGCDFSDGFWSSNHGRKKSCLSWNSVAYKREEREAALSITTFVLTGMHEARTWVKEIRFSWIQLTCHWCGAGCGKIKAGDFFVAILLDTDELSLIYHTRLQAWDGVGVPVARDGGFLPLPSRVFLQENGHSDSERLPRLQAGGSSDLTCCVVTNHCNI